MSSLINQPMTKDTTNNIAFSKIENSPVINKETGRSKNSIAGFRKLLILGLISYLIEYK